MMSNDLVWKNYDILSKNYFKKILGALSNRGPETNASIAYN